MEYLKKFYELLGTEMGNVRPLVNENTLPLPIDLPTSNPNPGRYVTPNKGFITTNFGIITVNNDLRLTLNGKVLMVSLRRPDSFRQLNTYDTLNVLKAKENGDKITLNLKLDTISSQRKETEFTLDVPQNQIKNLLDSGRISVNKDDDYFQIELLSKQK